MMLLKKKDARSFLKLFVLIYADDTVILTDTAEDLQTALNNYQLYCIKSSKTKVVIFARGKLPNYTFVLNEDDVDILHNYKYLSFILAEVVIFLVTK